MEQCIFCKIASKDIPARVVYEDDNYVALLDIVPRNKGQVQVIPKQHYRWVWDDPTIGDYMLVAQKIALAQKRAFDTDWVVSLISGEEVHHAHIWLIPRHQDDGHGSFFNPELVRDLSDAEMDDAMERIKAAL